MTTVKLYWAKMSALASLNSARRSFTQKECATQEVEDDVFQENFTLPVGLDHTKCVVLISLSSLFSFLNNVFLQAACDCLQGRQRRTQHQVSARNDNPRLCFSGRCHHRRRQSRQHGRIRRVTNSAEVHPYHTVRPLPCSKCTTQLMK